MMKAMIRRDNGKHGESEKQLGAVPILGHRVLGRRTITSCSELDHQETQVHLRMGGGAVVVLGYPFTRVAWEGVGVGCKWRTVGKLKPSWVVGKW